MKVDEIRMKIERVVPHQMFQRNAEGLADIPFGVMIVSPPIQRFVIVEAMTSLTAGEWEVVARLDALEPCAGVLRGIPTGRVSLRFTLWDVAVREALESIVIEPIFVGDLWLLAGQSNMQGCGTLLEVEEACEGVSCFYLDDRWDQAEDPLCWFREAVDPVHWGMPAEQVEEAARKERLHRERGAGLGIAFGKELLRETGVPVGLIMCAHGGTGMKEWDPDLAYLEGRSLYGSMLRRVKAAGGSVKGCLWYQGESDANEEQGPLYAGRFEHFVERLRADLGEPGLPFLYAQLAVFHAWNKNHEIWWDHVQHDQLTLEERLQPCALVPAIDADLSDPIHLDAGSLRELGRRFAWQALRLAHGIDRPVGPRPASMAWSGDRTELTIRIAGMNGLLMPEKTAFGFELEAGGEPWELAHAGIVATRDAVVLRFTLPVPPGSRLWHGRGYYPAVNVRDTAGIPLPAFGPVTV